MLSGGWTLGPLAAKMAEEHYNVWVNAKAKANADAQVLARFIEASGLQYAPTGGISMSDPQVIEMRDVFESAEGAAACLKATTNGLPTLAGVEPMMVEWMLSKGYKIEKQKKDTREAGRKDRSVLGDAVGGRSNAQCRMRKVH